MDRYTSSQRLGRWVLLALVAAGFTSAAGRAFAQSPPWQQSPPMLTERRLLAAAAHGGKVYTFGGCGYPCFDPPFHTSTFEETRVEVFDPHPSPGSPPWIEKQPMPFIFFGGAAAAPGNGKIYTVGGFVTGNVLAEYDPWADSWALRAPMPTPRHGLAAVALGNALDDKVYALGGSDGTAPSAALEIYAPATNSWTIGPPMPTARVFLAAAAAGGKIYAIGGSPDCCGNSVTAAVEVYDPATNSWTAAAPLPVALQTSAATELNDKIYVFGGFIPGQGAQRSTFEYDPMMDSWAEREPMPAGPRDQAPAVPLDDCSYLLGGSVDCHCQALGRNEAFCPLTPRCSPVGPQAELVVEIDDGTREVEPCLPVTYRVTVRNDGPCAVSGAPVSADFPPSLNGVRWSCTTSGGASCSPLPGSGNIADTVNLPSGGRVLYRATGTVDVGAPATHIATARVEAPPGVTDLVAGNNLDEDRDRVSQAEADLRIRKNNGLDQVTVGGAVTYAIEVTNDGPSHCPAEGTVLDPFPPELAGVSWTCSGPPGACCTASGTGRIADCVTLERGESVTFRATGTVEAPVPCSGSPCLSVPLSNTARIRPSGGACGAARQPEVCDPDLSNNRATDVDDILPGPPALADLAIVKATAGGGTIFLAGSELVYLLTVTNAGPDAVASAIVLDELPAAVEGATWSCGSSTSEAACTPAGGSGSVEGLVSLPAGGEVTYTVAGHLRPDFLGSLVNRATVAALSEVLDSDPGNNSSSVTVVVFRPGPSFHAAKTVASFSQVDATVTYAVELLNPGPLAQPDNQGSEFVDALPRSLTLLSGTASSGTLVLSGNTVVWDGEIPPSGRVLITITAGIKPGFLPEDICNRGKLFADPDADGDNDDVGATDDPSLPGEGDPTCLRPDSVLGIPTLSMLALCLFALGLAGAGLRRLAGRQHAR